MPAHIWRRSSHLANEALPCQSLCHQPRKIRVGMARCFRLIRRLRAALRTMPAVRTLRGRNADLLPPNARGEERPPFSYREVPHYERRRGTCYHEPATTLGSPVPVAFYARQNLMSSRNSGTSLKVTCVWWARVPKCRSSCLGNGPNGPLFFAFARASPALPVSTIGMKPRCWPKPPTPLLFIEKQCSPPSCLWNSAICKPARSLATCGYSGKQALHFLFVK